MIFVLNNQNLAIYQNELQINIPLLANTFDIQEVSRLIQLEKLQQSPVNNQIQLQTLRKEINQKFIKLVFSEYSNNISNIKTLFLNDKLEVALSEETYQVRGQIQQIIISQQNIVVRVNNEVYFLQNEDFVKLNVHCRNLVKKHTSYMPLMSKQIIQLPLNSEFQCNENQLLKMVDRLLFKLKNNILNENDSLKLVITENLVKSQMDFIVEGDTFQIVSLDENDQKLLQIADANQEVENCCFIQDFIIDNQKLTYLTNNSQFIEINCQKSVQVQCAVDMQNSSLISTPNGQFYTLIIQQIQNFVDFLIEKKLYELALKWFHQDKSYSKSAEKERKITFLLADQKFKNGEISSGFNIFSQLELNFDQIISYFNKFIPAHLTQFKLQFFTKEQVCLDFNLSQNAVVEIYSEVGKFIENSKIELFEEYREICSFFVIKAYQLGSVNEEYVWDLIRRNVFSFSEQTVNSLEIVEFTTENVKVYGQLLPFGYLMDRIDKFLIQKELIQSFGLGLVREQQQPEVIEVYKQFIQKLTFEQIIEIFSINVSELSRNLRLSLVDLSRFDDQQKLILFQIALENNNISQETDQLAIVQLFKENITTLSSLQFQDKQIVELIKKIDSNSIVDNEGSQLESLLINVIRLLKKGSLIYLDLLKEMQKDQFLIFQILLLQNSNQFVQAFDLALKNNKIHFAIQICQNLDQLVLFFKTGLQIQNKEIVHLAFLSIRQINSSILIDVLKNIVKEVQNLEFLQIKQLLHQCQMDQKYEDLIKQLNISIEKQIKQSD